MIDEKHIIKIIGEGDKIAFRKLYSLYNEKVYNTAISYLQNVEDSEEVTQDVFTSIYRNASKFKGQSKVSTWIYRITVNSSLNYLKKRSRSALSSLSKNRRIDFVHPGVILENKENSILLFRIINTLPESQKTAFILSYIEMLPRQEVANIMELSLKAAESLLQRAKQSLRKKLEMLYPNRRKI